MNHRIVALSYLGLTEDAMSALDELSNSPIDFPSQGTAFSATEMASRTGDADIVLVSPGVLIDQHYLDLVPNLKYIGLCGSSTSNIDVEYVKRKGIELTTVTHYGDEPTAEFIMAQLTNLLRGIGSYQWKNEPHELMGKTLGIIGLGAVGKTVADLALAYKMHIRYHGPHPKPDWDTKGLEYVEKAQLLSSSDIVLLSGPGGTEVLTEKDFEVFKESAVLIQASQGNVFDRDGFINWIEHDGNYAIFDLAAGNENYETYSKLPRVIFPKIIAGHSIETRERLSERVLENLKRYLEV